MNLNSKIILGTVQMGLPYGVNNTNGQVSLDESMRILNFAFDNGIKILDTAESYGNAHKVIGIFHKKNPNKKFKVITKILDKIDGIVVKKLDGYLNELNVFELDTLMFHSYSSYKNNIKNFDVLKNLKLEKKIKNIGVSVYTNDEVDSVISNKHVDIIQLPFNLFDNINLRQDVIEKAKSNGKIVHTRSSLLQGLFFKDKDDINYEVQKLNKEFNLLSDISKRRNASILELALSYCLQQKLIDNVILGVDSLEQLIDNLDSLNYKIEQKTIDEINTIVVKELDLLNPSLWK